MTGLFSLRALLLSLGLWGGSSAALATRASSTLPSRQDVGPALLKWQLMKDIASSSTVLILGPALSSGTDSRDKRGDSSTPICATAQQTGRASSSALTHNPNIQGQLYYSDRGEGQGQCSHFDDLGASSLPAIGGVGGDISLSFKP